MSQQPLVSIIIPTRNRAKYLERALTSVFAAIERYPNSELIVIDGASTDGAVDILKKYDSRISYWDSEPDSGVGEAANKGFQKSKGEIILFFGDDDELFPDAIRSMVAHLCAHPEVDAVFGTAENIRHTAGGGVTPLALRAPMGRLTLRKLMRVTQDGWPTAELQFSRRRLYDQFGRFDTHYRYLGSYETWCRQVRAGAVLIQLPEIVARRHYTPDSGNVRFRKALLTELADILKRHGGTKAVLSMKLALFWQSEPSRRVASFWRTRIWFHLLGATRPLRRVVGLDQQGVEHFRQKLTAMASRRADTK